jgi:hypothetical protein
VFFAPNAKLGRYPLLGSRSRDFSRQPNFPTMLPPRQIDEPIFLDRSQPSPIASAPIDLCPNFKNISSTNADLLRRPIPWPWARSITWAAVSRATNYNGSSPAFLASRENSSSLARGFGAEVRMG